MLRARHQRLAGSVACLLAVLVTTCATALATDYFVRPDGSDASAGTANTAAGAWATIAKCAQTAKAGDRCLIQPGTYRERSIAQANAGSLESNNLLANCTCTKGSRTITCGTAIPATVNAGDYVQCDSGFGFSWTQVASTSGTTITLAEDYRGANSTTAGTDTLDVARFVEFIGQGTAPGDVVLSNWYDATSSVTWTPVAGRSCAWSYDPAAVTGTDGAAQAWRGRFCSNDWYKACTKSSDCASGGSCNLMPRGMRDYNANWDRDVMGIANGLDPYYRLGDTTTDLDYNGSGGGLHDACPCGDGGRNKLDNIESVPGSYTYDTTGTTPKVYVSTRRRCNAGSRSGYTCYNDADCPGSACGACPNPASVQMQMSDWSAVGGDIATPFLKLRQNFTIARNFSLDAGDYGWGAGGGPNSSALYFGAANSLYEGLTVYTGIGWYVMSDPAGGTAGASDLNFKDVRLLNGSRCTPAGDGVSSSGLAFYHNEIRGSANQLWSCDSLGGPSAEDRAKIQRGFYHRNFRGLGTNTCGMGQDSWSCSTKYWTTQYQQWDPGHGVYHGSAGATFNLDHILVENTILEASSDGFQVSSKSGADVVFRNNTLGTQGNVPNESLDALFGTFTVGSSGTATLRNNMFVMTGTQGGTGGVGDYPGTDQTKINSDYNLFVNPFIDANGGSATPASGRVWRTNDPGNTLSAVISSRNQEKHSIYVCSQGCQGASPGTHIDSPSDARLVDFQLTDFTPTDYTPKSNNWGVNAGDDTNCPTEDFYGRPRSDGRCDIGAIEYQASGPDTTPPSPVTAFTTTAGDTQVRLNWNHSASSDSRGTRIRFSTTGYPTGPSDGTLACDKTGAPGVADSCVHAGLVNGTLYYYAAFSYDAVPNYGTAVKAQATPNATANTPPPDVGNNHRTDVH